MSVTKTTNWAELANATNALATATRAAKAGVTHVITGFKASFSASASGILLQIKDGATVIDEVYVYDLAGFVYPQGMRGTKGNAVSAELAAGGAGIVGRVSLIGYSVPVE